MADAGAPLLVGLRERVIHERALVSCVHGSTHDALVYVPLALGFRRQHDAHDELVAHAVLNGFAVTVLEDDAPVELVVAHLFGGCCCEKEGLRGLGENAVKHVLVRKVAGSVVGFVVDDEVRHGVLGFFKDIDQCRERLIRDCDQFGPVFVKERADVLRVGGEDATHATVLLIVATYADVVAGHVALPGGGAHVAVEIL